MLPVFTVIGIVILSEYILNSVVVSQHFTAVCTKLECLPHSTLENGAPYGTVL
jgi:hypothetical protein